MAHAAPPTPHADVAVPARHCPPAQHPPHELPQVHTPEEHESPLPQIVPSLTEVHAVVDTPGWQLWHAFAGFTAPDATL
jgi:hypothetical protein